MSAAGPEQFEIQVETHDNVTLVRLTGELDAAESSRLRETLVGLVKDRVERLCVDMAGLGFINSAGIATLIECLQGMRAYQGGLALAGLNERIHNVFEVARLDTVFGIHADVDAAIAALSEDPG